MLTTKFCLLTINVCFTPLLAGSTCKFTFNAGLKPGVTFRTASHLFFMWSPTRSTSIISKTEKTPFLCAPTS